MRLRFTSCRLGTYCFVSLIVSICLLCLTTLSAQQSFTSITPPNTVVGENYVGYLFRAAGATSFALSPSSRPLPLGLRLNRNGTLEGRTTQVGTYSGIVIRASGSMVIDSRLITILVLPANAPTDFLSVAALTTTVATATSLVIGRSNGLPAPTFELAPSSSPLPEGLRIEGNRIIGMPRQAGIVENIIVRASNRIGFVDSRPLALTIQSSSVRQAFGAPNLSLLFRSGLNGGVTSVVPQNGFYVVGGTFNTFDGRRVPPLIRISPEGRFDNTFTPRKADGTPLVIGSVRQVLRLPDDKLIVAGQFAELYDDDENEIYGEIVLRLLPEGMIDTTFRASGLDVGEIRDIALQSDGSVLIATADYGNVLRVDSRGRYDTKYILSPGGFTRGVHVQSDGNILTFTESGTIVRFLPDGKVDTTFRSTFRSPSGYDTDIWDIVELPNGNFFVCATTQTDFSDQIVVCAVLSPRGQMIFAPSHFSTIFTTPDPDFPDEIIPRNGMHSAKTALPLPDGKILLAVHTSAGFSLLRFNADFSLDTAFAPRMGKAIGTAYINGYEQITNNIQGLFFDTDFTACIFGNISQYEGLPQNGLIRINTTAQLQNLRGQAPPPSATVGAAYEPYRFRAAAEPAPFYTLAKHSASLPDGMTLSTSGVLSGVPTTTGVFSTIVVRAATGFIEQTFSTTFTITVLPQQSPVRFTAATPPVGLRGVTFATYQLQAEGSPLPTFELAASSPRLPRGMLLSTSGLLSGVPAVSGVTSLIVRASNRFGFLDGQVTLRIDNPIAPTQFANERNPTARVGVPFQYPLKVNGTSPIMYRLDEQLLPSGLMLSTNGVIVGVAERAGVYPDVLISAENSTGDISTTLSITVLPRVQDFTQLGSLDTAFAQNSRPNGPLWAILRQPDGSFIVGGECTQFGTTAIGNIARLSRTGAVDSTFNQSARGTNFNGANGAVFALARQADGGLLLGGRFTQYNGAVRRGIVRLNADGTLDNSFQVGLGFANAAAVSEVRALTLQQDGRILVGGNFTSYNGRSCSSLVRLHPDGTVDTAFHQSGLRGVDAPAGAVLLGAAPVGTIRLQSDGKIIIAGAFRGFFMPSYVERRGILRLNTDGSLDTSFRALRGASSAGNSFVTDVDVRGDSLIAVGNFSAYDNTSVGSLARLDGHGGLEFSSNIDEFGVFGSMQLNNAAFPSAIVRRADRSAIIIGNFRRFNGELRNGFLPLLPNGFIDRTLSGSFGFQNNTSGAFSGYPVAATLELNDDAMVVVGSFSHYDGTPQAGITRILLGRASTAPIILPFAEVPKNNARLASSQISSGEVSGSEREHERSVQSSVEVFPNPFSEAAELRVMLAKQGFMSLSVHDALGRQVAVLGEGLFDMGEHRFRIEASRFAASGVYHWRLQTVAGVRSGLISVVR